MDTQQTSQLTTTRYTLLLITHWCLNYNNIHTLHWHHNGHSCAVTTQWSRQGKTLHSKTNSKHCYKVLLVSKQHCNTIKMTHHHCILSAALAWDKNQIYGHHSHTELHLHAKFQLRAFCSFWAIAGSKKLVLSVSQLPNQPISSFDQQQSWGKTKSQTTSMSTATQAKIKHTLGFVT